MKTLRLLGALALLDLVLAASLPAVDQALPWQLRMGSTIMGSKIKNPQGQNLGTIHDSEALVATVEDTEGSLKLKTAEGNTVELAVPESVLQSRRPGDRVEIVMHKTQSASQQQQSGRQ